MKCKTYVMVQNARKASFGPEFGTHIGLKIGICRFWGSLKLDVNILGVTELKSREVPTVTCGNVMPSIGLCATPHYGGKYAPCYQSNLVPRSALCICRRYC